MEFGSSPFQTILAKLPGPIRQHVVPYALQERFVKDTLNRAYARGERDIQV